jgi:hypothetical protein
MAAGGIVSVTPVGPGQYKTDFANGNSVLLTGAEGENQFNRFQAAQSLAMGPGAVAGPGAGPEPGEGPGILSGIANRAGQALKAINPLVNPTGAVADATAAAMAPDAPKERVGKTTLDAPTAQPAPGGPTVPASAQAAAPGAESAGPVPLGYTMKAVDPATGKDIEGEAMKMPDGSIGVYRAPTRGSPGGLTSLGKQTMTQYGEAQQLAAEHSAKAAEAQQIGVDLAVQDAEARNAFVEEQKLQAQLEMQKQADEEAALQQKLVGLETSYETARQEFASARVDPDRYVKSKPGGNWILGLSAALGAFGAGLARTPNFAMEFISGRIADDMRAQESEINVKGREADNQLANLTRSLGDLKLAKTAFRQIKLEEAAYEAQRVAGQFKGQQIANNARMVSEQAAAEGIRAGEERSRSFVEHVMKDKLYYRQGSAGSAGGFLRPHLGGVQDVKTLQTPPKGPGAEAEARPVEGGRTEKISAYAAGITAALKVQENLEKRGVAADTFDDPATGAVDRVKNYSSNKDLNRNTDQLAAAYQAARGKSDKDADLAQKDAIGSGSGSDRTKAAAEGVEKFAAGIRAELVTLPPGKREEILGQMDPSVRAVVEGAK